MHRMLIVMACVLASVACSVSRAQTDSSASKPPMKREVFLVIAKASLNGACDVPNSPYACMVKNIETCRKNLPVAVDRCEPRMKSELPVEIKSEETRKWSTHISRCIVDEYVLLAGSANLNMGGCPRSGQ